MKNRRALLLLAFAAILPAAQAQTGKWPDKPVRVVVPFAPGGSNDVIARLLAPRLLEEFGQQFIVDNRGGAGGQIGATITVRANPDGYTVIIVSGSYAATPALQKLSYDPVRDIAPVALVADGPMIMAVHPSVKAGNLKEFIDLARATPGTIAFGSTGTGSIAHLAFERLQQQTKTSMIHVPFSGAGPAVTALLGGEIQFVFVSPAPAVPQIKAGKLRALAVTGEQRWSGMPELPAVNEVIPGFSANVWFGMWAPAGTPKPIISRLNQALARAIKQPEVQERFRAASLEPTHSTPEEF
ncbi:MAG TPA: tripartite tricarboxylate transporter substrate binding protein, partial [Burkholderiales bacterium]|nr:tripartite tricarboxylate transporter substrate binding protein [Burkholderiales bacterium]